MRAVVLIMLALIPCVLSGCNKPQAPDARPRELAGSRHIRTEAADCIKPVLLSADIPGEEVFADWSDIRGVSTNLGSTQAVLTLKSRDNSILWLDLSQGRTTRLVEFPRRQLFFDVTHQAAYSLGGSTEDGAMMLLKQPLPEGAPSVALSPDMAAWENKLIIGVASHPLSREIWITGHGVEGTGDPAAGWLDLHGTFKRVEPLPAGDIAGAQFAPLTNGLALYAVNGMVYLLGSEYQDCPEVFALPPGRDYKLCADVAEDRVGWVFVRPEIPSEGTGRAITPEKPGEIVAFRTNGEILGRMETGGMPMSQYAGDWQRRRAVFAQSETGIAVADFAREEYKWLMRNSGPMQFNLLSDGRNIWAVVNDGLVNISIDKLAELPAKLMANKVLTADQAQQVKPAVEALGWDYPGMQLSPLGPAGNLLTMFSTTGPDISWAEFEWSLTTRRAHRLLLARKPTDWDITLLAMPETDANGELRVLLAKLGWPDAVRDTERGFRHANELKYFYRLDPSVSGPGSPGEFQVWITDRAALLMLDSATAPMPDGVLSRAAAERAALGHAQDFFTALDPGCEIDLSITNTQAGWIEPSLHGIPRLATEPFEDAQACFMVELAVGGDHPRQIKVAIDAVTGDKLRIIDRGAPMPPDVS